MEQLKIGIKNLEFSYPDGNKAVNKLSLDIRKGESIGIIGANGAGKSTLLMLILGIIFPESGEILVDGKKVDKSNLEYIRKEIGMIFQNSDNQLFMTKVYDDVAFGPRNYKLPEAEVDKRVKDALSKVGALNLIDRYSYKLSGGEKKLAAIATVLAMEPGVLVMDEPTGALDPKARRKLIELLNKLDYTKIITSHDLDMILDTCERTVIIKNGIIVADGATRDIMRNKELLESSGLEMPLSLENCPVCGRLKNFVNLEERYENSSN